MLTRVNRLNSVIHKIFALLFFISTFTFHIFTFAYASEDLEEKYRALGYAEQQKGNLNEALAYYTKATSLGLDNPAVLNDMGVLYEEIDLYTKAEHFYLRAIQSDSRYLPAYINVAYLYQRLGKPEKAAQYFKLRYELGDSADPWAQKAKDELLKIHPEYREWVVSLEAETLNKNLVAKSREEFYLKIKRSQEHYKRGENYFEEGEYQKAIKEYDWALGVAPKNPQIINARKKAQLEIAKESVREQSELAIKRLEVGDTVSARHEIQKILTTIPSKPVLISR